MPIGTWCSKGFLELPCLVIVYILLGFSIYFPEVLMARSSESLEEFSPDQNFSSKIKEGHPPNSENEFNNNKIGGYEITSINEDFDLDRLYEKISELEILPYNNTKINE